MILAICFVAVVHAGQINQANEITYERLLQSDEEIGDASYVPCFNEIFKVLKVKTLLEFGLGYSTKYFLDSCKKVISIEVITHGYGPDFMKKFIQLYRDYSNWIPIAYFSGYQGDVNWAPYKYLASDNVYKACSHQCSVGVPHYSTIDNFYKKELNEFISNLTRYNKVDVVFINPALFLRGDLVEILFDKVPVIVAHATNSRKFGQTGKADTWGYSRLVARDEYEEIYIPTKSGTTVWISKTPEYQPLIQALKQL